VHSGSIPVAIVSREEARYQVAVDVSSFEIWVFFFLLKI
jgi:hypothetical protein